MKTHELFEQPQFEYELDIWLRSKAVDAQDAQSFAESLGGLLLDFYRHHGGVPFELTGGHPLRKGNAYYARVGFTQYEGMKKARRMIRRRQRGKPPIEIIASTR